MRGGAEGSGEGLGAGGERARPRMEATLARALRMGGPKERGCIERRRGGGIQETEHIFGCLLKIGLAGESRERDFVGGKIDFEDITFVHGVGKITFVAAVMLRGRADVPTKFTMFTKRRTGISRNVSDDFGTRGRNRSAVKVEIAVEGSIGRERRVNTRGAEEIQS